MSKTFIRFFIVISLLMLSACTSTVRGVNYELYKGRLQAQTYLMGRTYKPRPMIISRKNTRVAKPVTNNKAKKVTVRRAVSNTKRVYPRPVVKVRKAYKPPISKARTVYQRSFVRRAKKAQPYRKARSTYQRPVIKKPIRIQQRKARVAYTYKRPVARRVYVVPPSRTVRQRPIARRPYVAPQRRAVAPQSATPKIPLSQLNDNLFSAAKAGNIAQINSLLTQGAQINAANMSRETALHAAATLGRSATVNLLLQKGANPNATTTGGWTPLHSAARFRQTQVARLLVTRGAQVNRRNNQGKTPVALATQVGASATATALIALGGR
ncbi:MAG: ankyrin repeat domain-containing protein [Cocleimonas sp.]|nr:ankyrin repeat domain-containing protein [Cocleimonas sp.]